MCKSCALLVFVLAMLACTSEAFAGSDVATEPPSIVFIIVDDLNDYIGHYGGHPQAITPNIDSLAESGVAFTNAHTNAPVCQTARNSLFTGVYPHDSRDFGWTPRKQHAVLKNNKTFLHLLREGGYRLLGTGKLLHRNDQALWDEWGEPERFNYGPHAFNGTKIAPHPDVPQPFRDINIVDGSFAPLSDIPDFPDSEPGTSPGWGYRGPDEIFRYVSDDDRDLMPDEKHADWAVSMIEQLDNDKRTEPFFLAIGFVKPHTPLYAPKQYFDLYPLESVELPFRDDSWKTNTFFRENYPATQMGLHYYDALCESYDDCDEGLRRVVQAYLACVTFLDDQVGKVLDALNTSGLADNTLVIFTSDHGWQFGERNYLYKNSPWEESTRIPMIVRAPFEQVKGMQVDTPISLIDIFPTIQDYARLDGDTALREGAAATGGFSIRPLMSDPDAEWEGPDGALTVMGAGISKPIEGLAVIGNPEATWHVKVLKDLDPSYIDKQTYSYRTRRYRYIRYPNGREELYDRKNDPAELTNVVNIEQYSDIAASLREQTTALITGSTVQ